MIFAVCAAILVLLVLTAAWGPGTHVTFARRLLTEDLGEIPPEARKLIVAHEDHFLYGNIAADIISYKNYGGMKNHCHNWNIRERLLEHTDTDAELAFVYGYLCHLAADVVAHQHFVPFHIVHGLPPRLMGHLYWEARADAGIAPPLWERIDALRLDTALQESDRLVLAAVPKRAFSHTTNKFIFNHVLLARSRRSRRAIIDQMTAKRPRGVLQEKFLTACHERCRANLLAVFRDDDLAELRTRDPNGHDELAGSVRLRRDLIDEYGTRAAGAEASRHAARRTYGLDRSP